MNQQVQTTNSETNLINFKEETVQLIKKTIAADLTEQEFAMFLYQSRRSGLDPLARQIYAIKRAGKTNIQASIDGLRLVAQRSGNYAGQDEPVWEGTPKRLGFCAKVTVYKFSGNGQRYPAAVGVAFWEEYCPKEGQDFMWQKMPKTMLAKVAEALALRKAFPQELSGLYTSEEMDQAAPVSNTYPTPANNNNPTPPVQEARKHDVREEAVDGEVENSGEALIGELSEDEEEFINGELDESPSDFLNEDPTKCSDCDKTGLPQNVIDFSTKKYDRQLCWSDQQKEAARLAGKA